MDNERKEHIQGSLLMGTIISGMLIVFASLAGYPAAVIVALASGVSGAFIAMGVFGPTDYIGMPGIRVIQGDITPTEALRNTLRQYVALGLGFAGGFLLADLIL